ncbi:MAG TPA: hypothetical protein VLC46_18885 [Thermoanaerobaculia bacterium]|nr:hypothetical protein [Thermoanaerobaculia bacterium]
MTALIVTIALATFLIANIAAYFVLVRIHPRRRAIVIALVILGNVMWMFLPILNARTDFSVTLWVELGSCLENQLNVHPLS